MVKVGALIVGLLIAAAIAWDAGERHYDNCVDRAKTMYPGESTKDIWDDDPLGLTEEEARRERRNAIAGCSQAPW